MKTRKFACNMIVTAAVLIACTAAASAAGQSPADVPAGHWASNEIQSAVDKGITKGYADGTFKPAASVTNAHFAAFLARAFYASEIDQSVTSPWYAPYTNVLNAHGILDGNVLNSNLAKSASTVGTNFDANINQPINRYDMAAMMYNVLRDKGIPAPEWQELSAAKNSISDWNDIPVGNYRNPVCYCYAFGILKGQSNGAFGGYNLMNRAQACVVIYRLAQKIDNYDPMDGHVLTNGKPITEDNVLEIIEQIKKDYPQGTLYMPVGDKYLSDAIGRGYAAREGGCNGWAALCSDLIFGKFSNNKAHVQEDHSKIRPGDIIDIRDVNTNETSHYTIVVTKNDAISISDVDENGNHITITTFGTSDSSAGSNTVNWPSAGAIGFTNYEPYAHNSDCYWVVYTRYPD